MTGVGRKSAQGDVRISKDALAPRSHLHAKLLQSRSRPPLCDPMDYSPPGSSVHGFPRQEYWNGLPFRPPGDLPHPGIEPESFMSPALAGGFFTTSATWEAPKIPHVTAKMEDSPCYS